MAKRSRVIDQDKGWSKVVEQSKLPPQAVMVGFFSDREAPVRRKSPDEPVSVTQYATWNEFGAGGTPARPFMRLTFDLKHAKYVRVMRKLGSEIVIGNIEMRTALDIVGQMTIADIQNTIRKSKSYFRPNARSTILRKTSKTGKAKGQYKNQPLVDTGRMRASVVHQVVIGGEAVSPYPGGV